MCVCVFLGGGTPFRALFTIEQASYTDLHVERAHVASEDKENTQSSPVRFSGNAGTMESEPAN